MVRSTDRQKSDGVVGNARLTGGAALILLVLLAAEGATIPFVGELRVEHIFIGVLLIPPVLLKMASTGYRFLRYYRGSLAYRRKGPPPLFMRALAPAVVISTVALLASGIWVVVSGHGAGFAMTLHQASFIVWFGAMTLHVLGHLLELPSLATADWRRRGGSDARLAGAGLRFMLLSGSLLAGAAIAIAGMSYVAS